MDYTSELHKQGNTTVTRKRKSKAQNGETSLKRFPSESQAAVTSLVEVESPQSDDELHKYTRQTNSCEIN